MNKIFSVNNKSLAFLSAMAIVVMANSPLATATIQAGASVTPASNAASTSNIVTVQFTSSNTFERGDQLQVDFPAGFNVADATLQDCNFDGVISLTKMGQALTVHRENTLFATTVANGTMIQCHFGAIVNPSASGNSGNFSLTTKDFTNVTKDAAFTVPGVTIINGTLTKVSVVPATLVAGTTNNVTVKLTPGDNFPINGKIKITFPAGFDVSAAVLQDCNFSGDGFNGTIAGQVLTINRTSGPLSSDIMAGTDLTCMFSAIKNPGAGTTGTFTITTYTGMSVMIDTNTNVPAVTITAPVTPTPSPTPPTPPAPPPMTPPAPPPMTPPTPPSSPTPGPSPTPPSSPTPGPSPSPSGVPASNQCSGFIDILKTDTLCPAITYVKDKGIFSGYPDGTFQAGNIINRVETTKVILVGFGKSLQNCAGNDGFSDSDASQWYCKYVHTAKLLGILKGYPDGTLRPNQQINRVEMLKVFFTAMGKDFSSVAVDSNPYPDTPKDQWYAKYVQFAKLNALVDADLSGKFNPASGMKRGDVALLFYRAHLASML